MSSRFKPIFDRFKTFMLDKDIDFNIYFKQKVICYEEEKRRFILYELIEDNAVSCVNPVIDWQHNDKLWFFYDYRDKDFAAHVEFLTDYAPEIRLGNRLEVFS